jgi:outer membrane biosynthesis protein TonB
MSAGKPDMRWVFRAASIVAAILICSAALTWAQVSFKPAEIVSVTDVQYPIRSVADGIVVLDLSLDAKGAVTGSNILRDIVSLTPVAVSSVQSWKFNPAFEKGTPQPSEIRVAFAFRPRAYLAAPPKFTPVIPDAGPRPNERPGYIPVGIVSVAYPEYPWNAATAFFGAVVVQVHVDMKGKIGYVEVIRELSPFTRFALNAAKKWQFRAPTLNGKPVFSNVVIAFVFASPPSTD